MIPRVARATTERTPPLVLCRVRMTMRMSSRILSWVGAVSHLLFLLVVFLTFLLGRAKKRKADAPLSENPSKKRKVADDSQSEVISDSQSERASQTLDSATSAARVGANDTSIGQGLSDGDGAARSSDSGATAVPDGPTTAVTGPDGDGQRRQADVAAGAGASVAPGNTNAAASVCNVPADTVISETVDNPSDVASDAELFPLPKIPPNFGLPPDFKIYFKNKPYFPAKIVEIWTETKTGVYGKQRQPQLHQLLARWPKDVDIPLELDEFIRH